MKKLLSIFFIILFFSCSKKSDNNLPRLIVPKQENVVEVNSKDMLELNHYSFLIANTSNDPIIDMENRFNFDSQNKFFIRHRPDTILSRYKLKVVVDTSYLVSAKGFQYKYIPYPKYGIVDGLVNGKIPTNEQTKQYEKEFMKYYEDKYNQWNDYVKCYRLFILNKTNDTIHNRFKYIQEAKDLKGNWKPIECYYNFGGCGNPESYFFKLLPNNYMVYPIVKYNGDFRTQIRIKLYNAGNVYYSNEFIGFINNSQFGTKNLKVMFERENSSYNFDEVSKFFFLDL